MTNSLPDLDSPVREAARRDPVRLLETETVAQALIRLRSEQIGERIVYFYVTDAEGKLAGVVPTRRLLLSSPSTAVGDVMAHPVLSVAETEPFGTALTMLAEKRLLALPVVDSAGRLTGVLDISSYTQSLVDLDRRGSAEEAFQMVGVQIERERSKSVWWVLANRFPWLLCNIVSGFLAAFITHYFDNLLENVVALAFFIPLVLTISESVAMQTVTMSLQSLHGPARGRWAMREMRVGLLLGLVSGAIVGVFGFLWLGLATVAAVVAGAILMAAAVGATLGYFLPRLVHGLKLNPKIASGPAVLAVTDVAALSCYFGLSALALR